MMLDIPTIRYKSRPQHECRMLQTNFSTPGLSFLRLVTILKEGFDWIISSNWEVVT